MNIYFDIYGVLKGVASPKEDLVELITFVLDHFPGHIFWLSTYCRGGANNAVYALRDIFDENLLNRIGTEIQPADWRAMKTDGIDFSEPFFWLDDNLRQIDREVLELHGALDSHIDMNREDEKAAQKALAIIRNAILND